MIEKEMTEQQNHSDSVSWVDRINKRYKETGRIIPIRQRKLYEKIRDEFGGGRTCLDIGSSCGVGSNVLSHTARFVWGVDVNPEAIDYAQKMFERPNLDFEVIDIEDPPTRELAKFELITMIEVLEHLKSPDQALQNIKKFFQEGAIGIITVPNQANEQVRENEKKHGFHLHKFDAGQFYELLTKHFNSVVLYSVDNLETWAMEETVSGDSKDYLIAGKVEGVK